MCICVVSISDNEYKASINIKLIVRIVINRSHPHNCKKGQVIYIAY